MNRFQCVVRFALVLTLAASCSTGPPMPRSLMEFTEVDILSADVRRIRIDEVEVTSELGEMAWMEKMRIALELAGMAGAALEKVGYESVAVGQDAEFSIAYTIASGSRSRVAITNRVARMSFAIIDREREEVFYRSMTLNLSDSLPGDADAFDEVSPLILEYMDLILGNGDWE